MASGRKGNCGATKLHRMTSDYGMRAAIALNDLLPSQHRDKTVQRLFNVSLRTAKYLRAGRHWTTDRLSQASAALGAAFDAALYSPVSSAEHYSEMADIEDRLARLEVRIAEMDRGGDAGLASAQVAETRGEGRAVAVADGSVGGSMSRR